MNPFVGVTKNKDFSEKKRFYITLRKMVWCTTLE
jgi:hypothetical protein